jgi:hypothetical protein
MRARAEACSDRQARVRAAVVEAGHGLVLRALVEVHVGRGAGGGEAPEALAKRAEFHGISLSVYIRV